MKIPGKIHINSITQWSTRQLSARVFYALVALTAVVFALFRLVGYDMPYDENPDRNAPLLTGVLIWFMTALTAATLALTVWSMCRAARKSGNENRIVNRIPARRIAVCTAIGTVAVMVVCFAMSDTSQITVNGSAYTDSLGLRTAGMFVGASLLMVVAAVAAVAFGATRHIRK